MTFSLNLGGSYMNQTKIDVKDASKLYRLMIIWTIWRKECLNWACPVGLYAHLRQEHWR